MNEGNLSLMDILFALEERGKRAVNFTRQSLTYLNGYASQPIGRERKRYITTIIQDP